MGRGATGVHSTRRYTVGPFPHPHRIEAVRKNWLIKT